jgi:hypothetical protein
LTFPQRVRLRLQASSSRFPVPSFLHGACPSSGSLVLAPRLRALGSLPQASPASHCSLPSVTARDSPDHAASYHIPLTLTSHPALDCFSTTLCCLVQWSSTWGKRTPGGGGRTRKHLTAYGKFEKKKS